VKVILFGRSGMVGQGVLRECLLDPAVEHVHEKLEELVHEDVYDFSGVEARLSGYNARLFCLGVAPLRLPFNAAYMFRPGFIQPPHGVTSRTPMYRVLYAAFRPLVPVLRALFPGHVATTEQVGRAMLRAAKYGAPKAILEAPDIIALAAEGPAPH
jgi:hypothetical protein